MHSQYRICVCLISGVLILFSGVGAKTRWSTFHTIPDADLIDGGELLFDVNGYFLVGAPGGMAAKPNGMATLGVIEWVNISGGYAGGPTFGLKARILGETKDWMPSLALGVYNIFSHQESYWYDNHKDTISNEIYLSLGKSLENLRLRINIGVQSIPENEFDKVNPFAGIEKYFGNGLYTTFEFYRRQKEYVMALFVDWRFLKRRVEVYAGAVHLAGLFSGSKSDSTSDKFVQPGVRGGIRVNLNMKRSKSGGFSTLEDRVIQQNTIITSMKNDIDSLKKMMSRGNIHMDGLSKSIKALADSNGSDEGRYRMIAMEKLALLKGLYEQEPFEPEGVKIAMRELTVHRDNILPALLEIAVNKKEDPRIKTLAVAACGEIGTGAAADVLIEILGQTQVPEMKIEALIALGKLKELRASFLMLQLAADPNDAVAFTASEVLQKLEKETGVPLIVPVKQPRAVQSIPENKIGERQAGSTGLSEVIEEVVPKKEPVQKKEVVQKSEPSQSIQKVEKREFTESAIEKAPADTGAVKKDVAKSNSGTASQNIVAADTTSKKPANTTFVSGKTEVVNSKDTTVSDAPKPAEVKQEVIVKNEAVAKSESAAKKDTTNAKDKKAPEKTKKVKEPVVETGNW